MATRQQVQNVTRRMSEERATVLAKEAVELSRAGHKDVRLNLNFHMLFLAPHPRRSSSVRLTYFGCRKLQDA
jgi:hypothetical protein